MQLACSWSIDGLLAAGPFALLSGAKITISACDHSLAVMARKRTVDRVGLVTES